MSENVVQIDEKNFEKEVLQAAVPVLIDFWAVWCVPCKMIAPTIEELAAEYAGKAKFGKVNVDENRALAAKYGIRGIPSLLLFKGGKIADQMVGVHNKPEIAQIIDKAL